MNAIGHNFSNISIYASSHGPSGCVSEQPELPGDSFVGSYDDGSDGVEAKDVRAVCDLKSKSEPVTITVIATNDIHGQYGKLPKVSGIIKDLKAKYPDAVVVDGGDSSFNPPSSNKVRFGTAVKLMSAMDYDIMALGNHEFQYGKTAAVEEFVKKVDAQVICANVHSDKGGYLNGVQPYVIKDINGVKAAFVSVTELEKHKPGKDIERPIDCMNRLMPELQEQADIIIGLNHQGLSDDAKLAKAVDGISLIISSHDHEATEEPIQIGSYPNHTYIVESGSHCQMVGLSQITVDPDTHEILDFKFTNYPVETYQCSPDPVIQKMVSRQ